MKKPKKPTPVLYIAPIITSLLAVWYYTTDSVMEQLLIAFIFFTMIIPYSIQMYSFVIVNSLPKQTQTKRIHKNTNNNIGMYHKELVRLLSNSMKNRKLTRHQILEFKRELNGLLGDVISDYSGFRFENDLHEIYTKLKSPLLNDKQYQYLISLLEVSLLSNDDTLVKCKDIV